MYRIYCTEARGRDRSRSGPRAECKCHPLLSMMPCISSARDTATMNTHRTLEKDKLILLETVLQSRSLSQLSNGDRTSDRIVIEGC